MNCSTAGDQDGSSYDAVVQRINGIAEQLKSLRYECANCLNKIRHDKAVFSCRDCYCIFHLYCIKRWAKEDASGDGNAFRCPHCQVVQRSDLKYYCFCGKVRDPKYDPHITPHSCGDTCGKARPNNCPHSCPLPCHPGPCVPCSAVSGPGSCGCGSTSYTWRCGQPDPLKTCDRICGKMLSCGKHLCPDKCHHGACRGCSKQSTTSCHCGSEVRPMRCGSTVFSCGKVCGRELKCGVHHCERMCHEGTCPPCKTDPSVVATCPCGSVPLVVVRTRCSDPVPVCGNVCGRWLDCGEHKCDAKCHEGGCEPCQQQVAATCSCGKTQATLPCLMRRSFRCNKVCKAALSCGKHQCRARCCPARKGNNADAHCCRQVCNKKLSCGHNCMELCHRGPCPSCPNVVSERLRCRCGAEELMPPQPCGTKPPQCNRPCSVPLPCGHPTGSHICHFGDCPPCMFPVERLCAGGHRIVRNVPCSAESTTCTYKCGKQLSCGHKCVRFCHGGPCVDEQRPCGQPCGKIQDVCGHACASKCHGSANCPVCIVVEELHCECRRRVVQVSCGKLIQFKKEHQGQRYLIKCDAECLAVQRLEILSKRIKPHPPIKYSVFLWEAALTDVEQIRKFERILHTFVVGCEGVMCLGAMAAPKRAIVHNMCHYYHINSESVDSEPRRGCLLTRTPKTKLPDPLLSVAIATPEQHSPLFFMERICQEDKLVATHVIVVNGEHANTVTIARVLHDFAGEFVCEEGGLNNGVPRLRLFFVQKAKRGEAYRHLQAVKPPFEFYIPSADDGKEFRKLQNPWSKITSWRERETR